MTEDRAYEHAWTIQRHSWPLYRRLWRFYRIHLEFGGWGRLVRLRRGGQTQLVGVRARFNGELHLVDVQGQTVLLIFNRYGPHDALPRRFAAACQERGELPDGWGTPVGQPLADPATKACLGGAAAQQPLHGSEANIAS